MITVVISVCIEFIVRNWVLYRLLVPLLPQNRILSHLLNLRLIQRWPHSHCAQLLLSHFGKSSGVGCCTFLTFNNNFEIICENFQSLIQMLLSALCSMISNFICVAMLYFLGILSSLVAMFGTMFSPYLVLVCASFLLTSFPFTCSLLPQESSQRPFTSNSMSRQEHRHTRWAKATQ